MINNSSLLQIKPNIKHKFSFVILTALLLLVLQAACCFGDTSEYSEPKIIADEEIIALIPPSLQEYFDVEQGLSADTVASLDGEFFLSFIISALQESISSAVSLFLILLSIIAISSVINSFSSNLSPSIYSSLSFASSLCCSLALFSLMGDDISEVVEAVDSTNTFLSSLAPVMSVIYASAGKINSGAVAASSTLFTVSLTEIMTHSILMPILRICFSLEVISSISGKNHLSGIASALKNTFIFICGGIMTVLTAVFTYQTVVAQSADNTLLKTARFAMGSLPVVGGALSEASRTLLGAFELVKSLTGGLGICVLLLTVLPPLIYVFVSKTALTLSRILASSLECGQLSSIIKGGEDILSFSMAILIVFDITAIFSLSIFLMISL